MPSRPRPCSCLDAQLGQHMAVGNEEPKEEMMIFLASCGPAVRLGRSLVSGDIHVSASSVSGYRTPRSARGRGPNCRAARSPPPAVGPVCHALAARPDAPPPERPPPPPLHVSSRSVNPSHARPFPTVSPDLSVPVLCLDPETLCFHTPVSPRRPRNSLSRF